MQVHLQDQNILRRTLHIADLLQGTTALHIREACRPHGEVVEIYISYSGNRKFALVEFQTVACADALWVATGIFVDGAFCPVSRALRPAKLNDPTSVIFGRVPSLGRTLKDPKFAAFSIEKFEFLDALVSKTVTLILSRYQNSVT